MKSSSVRGLRAGSSLKITGWFGTIRSSATTVPVSLAVSTSHDDGAFGALRSLRPPLMKRRPTSLDTLSGATTNSQCFQIGCSTSASDSHRCDVRSMSVAVAPSPRIVFVAFHAKLSSGAATYLSSAVCDARAVDEAGS